MPPPKKCRQSSQDNASKARAFKVQGVTNPSAKYVKNAKNQAAGQRGIDAYLAKAATATKPKPPTTARDCEPTEAKHTRGIVNIGNSCFMSVVLVVCINAVPGFVPQAPNWDDYEAQLHEKDTPPTDEERKATFEQFKAHVDNSERTKTAYLAVQDVLARTVDVNARKQALKSLRGEFTTAAQQEDAQQFFTWLADGHSLFTCQRSSTLRCCSCGMEHTKLEKDLGLWLEPQPGATLKDCFMSFAQGEGVDRNCSCGGTRAEKTDAVLALPPIMVLQLKQHRDARSRMPLQFPTELSATDLQPLTTEEPADRKLIGVVYYHQYGRQRGGTASNGHFTVAILREDGTWWRYDDAKVTCIRAEDLCTHDSYMLFYSRIDSPTTTTASCSVSAAMLRAPAGSPFLPALASRSARMLCTHVVWQRPV